MRPRIITALTLVAAMAAGGPDTASGEDLLPDLIVREAELHEHDVVTDGHRILLRLSTATANIGPGPVRVEGVFPPNPDGSQSVNQVVFREDGSRYTRPAGRFEHHPTHHHVHVEDWAVYRLREFLPGGGVGNVIAQGAKTSFCLRDSAVHDRDLPGAPAQRVYTECQETVQGISVGWMDYYHRRLYGQNIDVRGLPRGDYWLEAEVDPENHLLEQDEGNNLTRIPVTIGEPEFVAGPLEISPDDGAPGVPARIDLTVGYRNSPRFHRGDNVYFPTPQVLPIQGLGRRTFPVFSSVENEEAGHRDVRLTVVRFRSKTIRWRHFARNGTARRNVTAALAGAGLALHLEPGVASRHQAVGKVLSRDRAVRKGKPRVSGLTIRVRPTAGSGGPLDQARVLVRP